MSTIDLDDPVQRNGAVYFVVGRGTEGGDASYRLSIAGVGSGEWGTVSAVAANSGYSIGTIQVDLGQRGHWPLGAVEDRALQPGETTYVDAIIGQAAAYAQAHQLAFPTDAAGLAALRSDLLSHGNGQNGRSSLRFIDATHRDTLNAWAGSSDGQQWIHRHIDFPQVQSLADQAKGALDQYGDHIPAEHRFEVLCILAKSANQHPASYRRLVESLQQGADYPTFMDEVARRNAAVPYYAGDTAGLLARQYQDNFAKPGNAIAMEEAHRMVASDSYRPSDEARQPDIGSALAAFGGPVNDPSVLDRGDRGEDVAALQRALIASGQTLTDDGDFGRGTERQLTAYQRTHQLDPTGFGDRQTLQSLGMAAHLDLRTSLALHRLVESLQAGGRYSDAQIARIATSSQNYLLEHQAALGEVPRIQLSNDGSKLLFRNDYAQTREMDVQQAIRGYVPAQPVVSASGPSNERAAEPVRQ